MHIKEFKQILEFNQEMVQKEDNLCKEIQDKITQILEKEKYLYLTDKPIVQDSMDGYFTSIRLEQDGSVSLFYEDDGEIDEDRVESLHDMDLSYSFNIMGLVIQALAKKYNLDLYIKLGEGTFYTKDKVEVEPAEKIAEFTADYEGRNISFICGQ